MILTITNSLGDASNRELVARKCGNEFDRYLSCGSSGDNLGIAASGDVRCCNNRSVFNGIYPSFKDLYRGAEF